MTDFGTDITEELTWHRVSGLENLARAIARRYITPRGALWYAPNYGLDLRVYLHEAVTPERLEELRILVEQECEKDPRVLFARAEVNVEPGHRLQVRIVAETDDTPVELVVSVDRLNVEVLNAYPG
ncbi:hypothetical protein [Thermus tengchongensis]|uniref:DUF2634 domain-containing protein n=1 Tax=Thermus tengchongensis TaxID=1214928 RepID=A0A4Y9F905_9DEIN|nr:hypothetical protein [Thermus tengchongensis]TFU25646.1 hypothetical protein E0687_10105 [Thermus tengchongensis]